MALSLVGPAACARVIAGLRSATFSRQRLRSASTLRSRMYLVGDALKPTCLTPVTTTPPRRPSHALIIPASSRPRPPPVKGGRKPLGSRPGRRTWVFTPWLRRGARGRPRFESADRSCCNTARHTLLRGTPQRRRGARRSSGTLSVTMIKPGVGWGASRDHLFAISMVTAQISLVLQPFTLRVVLWRLL